MNGVDLNGYSEKLIPEKEIRNWTGPFDDKDYYYNLGKDQAQRIIQWLSIKKDQKILDVGCGCGRIAIHFLDYLKEGTYIGIDSNNKLISFCEDNISPTYNNFRFEFVDAYNGSYSPKSKVRCQEVVFPVEDNSMDVVIMWSVFTHMFLTDIEAYLKEIYRVLKRGGLFIASFNLHN